MTDMRNLNACYVNEFVACLLGVKQTSPTDKGYVPTLFPYQKKKQLRQTNNSNLTIVYIIRSLILIMCV
jgi:hypothetical protein